MTKPISNSEADFSVMKNAATMLRSIISEDQFHGVISAADAAAMAAANGWTLEQLALALLPFAQAYAIAPISNYKVGAVVIGGSGALYYGANLEVKGEALSFSLHAEQSAISNAWINGENSARSIAISAAPCGYCRQFLYELIDADKFMVALPGQDPQLLTWFLPDAFGPHDLGQTGGLMEPQDHGLQWNAPDMASQYALNAANMSYSPYTATYAGIGITTGAGVTVMGVYAENAAFNPSLSPLEGALSQLAFYNQPFSAITEVVLVEPMNSPASQIGATQVLLGAVTSVPLTVHCV